MRCGKTRACCRTCHLPLQSGSASVLRRMARKTTPDSFRQLVQAARSAIPQVAITTDVIAGFPGETEAEFQETLDFVREIGFAGGHVFTYSSRPGTPAARMKNHLPPEVKKARSAQLRALFGELSEAYCRAFWARRSKCCEIHQRTGRMGLADGRADRQLLPRQRPCAFAALERSQPRADHRTDAGRPAGELARR